MMKEFLVFAALSFALVGIEAGVFWMTRVPVSDPECACVQGKLAP